MSCKKLLNDPETCVDEMLKGITATYPCLSLIAEQRIIFHARNVAERVTLLSGGGAGHEPFAAGFVGEGMLTAAITGSIFTSPPSSNILHAIKIVSELNCNSGILVIVPNYTGDRLNFGLAAEEASFLGIKVKIIQIGEDCALLNDNETTNGSGRGLCGHLFIFKIAGAMASEGLSLDCIMDVCNSVSKSMATFGVCLKPCSLPGQDALFQLGDDEIELGLGIHGEAGVSKLKLSTASEVVTLILKKLCKSLSLTKGSEVCVLINNLGGTSQLEMGIVANAVKSQLGERGIIVHRQYVGSFMTSLEMSGVQVCLLKVESNQQWLHYLDTPSEAPAWPGSPSSIPPSAEVFSPLNAISKKDSTFVGNVSLKLDERGALIFKNCLTTSAAALIYHTKMLNDLDSTCGDGDTGTTLHRFASEIRNGFVKGTLSAESPVLCFHQLAKIASEKIGGTSGAVYGLFFRGLSSSLSGLTRSHWASALIAATECIMKYSHAKLGDRTLLDTLIPACNIFKESLGTSDPIQNVLKKISEEAKKACDKTSQMKARVGRASYVNDAYVSNVDAGAFAVTVIVEAIRDSLSPS